MDRKETAKVAEKIVQDTTREMGRLLLRKNRKALSDRQAVFHAILCNYMRIDEKGLRKVTVK